VAVETELGLPERYRDAECIGRGGMADIYRARDEVLGREVAIKVLAERYVDDAEVGKRFRQEARAAALLSGSPHVVTIYDVGEDDGRPFIVMELLAGGSLEDLVRREGRQPAGRVLAWLEEAAEALDEAHRRGVVHRDVKPANLLLDRAGVLHVADFGIASAAGMQSLTMTGTVLGTAGYLSPEQAQGERATAASDRYALAVVAFELLSGSRPFASESMTAEASAHVHAPVPSACERAPELPCELDRVFEQGLAKSPAARFGSCAELVSALRAAFDEAAGKTAALQPSLASGDRPQPASAAYQAQTPLPSVSRSRPLWPWLIAVLVVAAGGGIAAFLGAGGGSGSSERSRTAARTVSTQTTTTPATTTPATTTAPATTTRPAETTTTASTPPPATGQSGSSLNDRGWELMQRGDYAGALPLLEQAQAILNGTGGLAEAYNDYNLAYTRLQLGDCDGVVELLHESQSLQPHRVEIDQALARAGREC
jgi:serine/threonine protein kinase